MLWADEELMRGLSGLLRYAGVLDTGAVLLGYSFAADGYADRPVRIISHAHSDHMLGLRESLQRSALIIATPATIELVEELGRLSMRNRYLFRQKALPLQYHRKISYEGEKLFLAPARHIVGAAQVVVETENGVRIAYTGDFRLKGTEIIMSPDVLIIEATYGSPRFRRPFKEEVEELLIDLVLDSVRKRPVVVYGYYGKLQEAMEILRRGGVEEPFVMPEKIYRVTRIAEKYGYMIDNYYMDTSISGKEIMARGRGYIYFAHMARARYRRLSGVSNIVLSGWEFREPVRRLDAVSWLVALSDHADYDELIEYVRRSRPRLVIVDASRQGAADELADAVRRLLGIPAITLPSNQPPETIMEYLGEELV